MIYQWDEEGPLFHDELADQYFTKVKLLLSDYLQSLPEGERMFLFETKHRPDA